MRRTALVLLGLAAACSREKAPPADDAGSISELPPAMEILSPRGGERWVEGSQQVIRWRTRGLSMINIGAAVGGKDKGHLLLSVSALPDSLVWEIPIGFVTGFGPDCATNVRIRLENAADPAQFVESEPFTITGEAHVRLH
jgi:hypothetical protein